ncbi:accessory factor associated with RNA polymerase II [Coemansia javaensis]|uniref:Accessory factor associated with RNA polymerase II n=1 Tax=Coemansia javaensis TaxID=2761396 RepID=A0A9W8LIA2_9FUNG|nr:accessory factor associated with RNA polymerase II [Coemansia javaensis]
MAAAAAASGGAGPLELLRQYTMQGKAVELLDKEGSATTDLQQAARVRFGEDGTFARDEPTGYLRSNSESDQYMLSALLHFLAHRDQSFYEYMKLTSTRGLQTVSFSDRATLLDYLTGKLAAVPAASSAAAAAAAGHKAAEGRRAPARSADAAGPGAGAAAAAAAADGDAPDAAGDVARGILRRERVLVTTSTALSSGKSFAHVAGLVKELLPSKPAAGAKGAAPAAPSAAAAASAGAAATAAAAAGQKHKPAGHRAPHRKRRDPIIVVPAATTAMINMYNIKALLQDHTFADGRAVMERGGPKPREVVVEHTMASTGQALRFRVVDSVQDFGEADWNSLVCVLTQGAAWQFKNWLWKTPEEVFQNCLGLYPKHQDEQPKDSIRSWAVAPLNIERSKRHMDRATVAGLWKSIEEYMARHKPDFLQQ